jgi:hypothetical protein
MMTIISHAPSIELAKSVSAVTFCTSLIILAAVLMLRFLRNRRSHRETLFQESWKTLFAATINGQLPPDIPAVAPVYAMPFYRLWTHFHESLRGDARERLCRLMYSAGGGKIALKWLHGFSVRKKLMAVVVLGYLKEKSTCRTMRQLVRKKNTLLSLVAARALLRIDPDAGLPFLMPLMVTRTDWSPEFIKNALKEIPQDALVDVMGPAMEKTSDAIIPRLIGYLEVCAYEKSVPIVRKLVQRKRSPEVIVACLDFFRDPRDIAHVMKFAGHPAWTVRRSVAGALERFGTDTELDVLIGMLADPEWEVRYRAAQSLLKLPFADKNRILAMKEEDTDPRIRAILSQVLAEEAIRS